MVYTTVHFMRSYVVPWWLNGRNICLQCGRLGFDPWVGKIPWRRKWQPTPVLLPRKSHRRRSLVGYSLWGRTQLSDFTFLSVYVGVGNKSKN